MYDAREKAIRDRQWALNASRREGLIEGKIEGIIEGMIEIIRTLQEILNEPVGIDQDFEGKNLDQLQTQIAELQERLRNRRTP